MSTELESLVSKLAIESGAEANMGESFEPHEVEEGDIIIFRDMSPDTSVRIVGVCIANQNGMLAVLSAFKNGIIYRTKYIDVENLQLLYRTHNIIHQNELKGLCFKASEYCEKHGRWQRAEDVFMKLLIEWRQEKFHPTPPPKLSFFKRLKKFIYE